MDKFRPFKWPSSAHCVTRQNTEKRNRKNAIAKTVKVAMTNSYHGKSHIKKTSVLHEIKLKIVESVKHPLTLESRAHFSKRLYFS